jgi:type IV pilus assembly protein PilA
LTNGVKLVILLLTQYENCVRIVPSVGSVMSSRRLNVRGFTLVEIMIVVVIIGLPAFQKVRASSQDRAVLNNLRQLGAGADQYFLENGVSSVASSTLMGTNSTQYVKVFPTVAQETYTPVIVSGTAITATGISGARTVTFGM